MQDWEIAGLPSPLLQAVRPEDKVEGVGSSQGGHDQR